MSASEPPATSTPIPPTWVRDAFDSERTFALRQSIRGMETQLVDLVFQNSPTGGFMEWLRTPLVCAAATGGLAAVERLLAAGVDIEVPPQRSRPAPLLHLAAEGGHAGVLEELLKAGVNVRETDSACHDRAALHCAAAAGNDAAVRALICAGADVNVLDVREWTPLQYACVMGHRSVVVFLLLQGADVQTGLAAKQPVLHTAAINNYPGVIEDLLVFGNVSIGCLDPDGQSALHMATRFCEVEACVALLRAGASAGQTTRNGLNRLDIAASSGHTGRLLQVLTAAEAADNRKRMCSAALYHAVTANRPDTIRDLVSLGGDVAYVKTNTVPHLHCVAVYALYKTAEALLRADYNVEARFIGRTPLHLACCFSKAGIVRLLLYWGADENARDPDGRTPSELIGTRVPSPDAELLPANIASNKLAEDSIRTMLETAPADRTWRRRNWLVLCRARWLARTGKEAKRFCAPLECFPDCAMGVKKRRGKLPGSALGVKARGFHLDEGEAHARNEGGGSRPPVTTASSAEMSSFGTCSGFGDGGAGWAAGSAKLDGGTRFVEVVEKLLKLREDSIFREVVTFL